MSDPNYTASDFHESPCPTCGDATTEPQCRRCARSAAECAEHGNPACDVCHCRVITVTVVTNPRITGSASSSIVFTECARAGDRVQLRPDWYSTANPAGPWMPIESVPFFVADLAGRVDLPPCGDPLIDAVTSGAAELLGKGDDGIAFRVGEWVVKVSTTVPFQPMNPGHRTPLEARLMLRCQVENANPLVDAGVPGLQRSEYREHGAKGFQIRRWVAIPTTWTAAQVDSIEATVRAIHRHGFALYDDVQPGIEPGGRVVLYDVGKLAPGRPDARPKWCSPEALDLDRVTALRRRSESCTILP